ncbi:hypothetical protein [Thermovibrio sp.]
MSNGLQRRLPEEIIEKFFSGNSDDLRELLLAKVEIRVYLKN